MRFARDGALSENEIRRMLKEHGFTIGNLSYRLDLNANFFEYRMIIRTSRGDNAKQFADALRKIDGVKEFRIAPTGD